MTDLNELFQGLPSAPLLSKVLLDPTTAIEVGGIYRLDYERALVITNDLWKRRAGGVPQHCFLLATAKSIGGTDIDDDEVLLLRVEKAAQLAQERDLLAVREEAMRDVLLSDGETVETLIDPYTRDRIQFSGLDCQVLGTFYQDNPNKQSVIEWGSDLDNFYASSRYRVFKPVGAALSYIASYAKPDRRDPKTVPIGVVRYASTRRRAVSAGHEAAEVKVQIGDFVRAKTAMFGMTRMGKSNTMKTVAAQVAIWSAENDTSVGQLLFDPAGEYANSNTQDRTALAAIGTEHVRIYKYGASGAEPNVKPLGINFFDPGQIESVHGTIVNALMGTGDYVKAFMAADFSGQAADGETEQDTRRRAARAARGRLLLYGALVKADFVAPQKSSENPTFDYSIFLTMKKEIADQIEVDLPSALLRTDAMKRSGQVAVKRDHILAVCDWLIIQDPARPAPVAAAIAEFCDCDQWQSTLPIYTQVSQKKQVTGFGKLKPLRTFHNPNARRDPGDDIYDDLVAGRIVIVDLHLGPDDVITKLSERIVLRILSRQNDVFTNNIDPPLMQVFVEEAHTLFDRRRFASDERDPWVTLAKEAAKFNIGLVYATQEVTGVDHSVLANTKNWVVAHLNNEGEVRELSKFYDFGAYAESIVRAEDRGFVRLKTESCPFIVPVQVRMFGPEQINEVRHALGLGPVAFDGAAASNGATPSPHGTSPAAEPY